MGDDFYLRAFSDLNTCRQIGVAAGPIPWRDIIHYADRCGLEPEVEEAFIRIIRAMDTAYLEWSHQEEERRKGSK